MRQQVPANLIVVDHTPKLADEIPTLENGDLAQGLMSITRRLKESLKWSDGNGVTAEDVAFTWQYCTYVSRCLSRRSITDSGGSRQVAPTPRRSRLPNNQIVTGESSLFPPLTNFGFKLLKRLTERKIRTAEKMLLFCVGFIT